MSRFSIHIVSMFSALLILVVGCFAYSPTVSAEAAEDLIISSGENSEVAVGGDMPEGLLFDTMVHMLRRGASIDCSNSEEGLFDTFLQNLKNDIAETILQNTDLTEVSWLSFNGSLNPLDWEITDRWQLSLSGVENDLARQYLNRRRLRISQETSSEVETSPDPDYLSILDKINGSGFWWRDTPNVNLNRYGHSKPAGLSVYPPSLCSWSNTRYSSIPFEPVSSFSSSPIVYSTDILDINIVSSGSSYLFYLDVSGSDILENFYVSLSGNNFYRFGNVTTNGFEGNSLGNSSSVINYSVSGSLADCLNYVAAYFRNVNIYVDGVPWSIVGTNAPIDIPVGGNTYITNTDTPVIYEYPDPAYFDYQTLYNLFETLFNNHQVIRWEDIQGVITDVDGVPVVSTVQVYRTDYDNLANEQLRFVPYFYNDQDMTEPIQNGTNIINISTSVIPDDLLVVFIWCGGVLLFALVVRRLLE